MSKSETTAAKNCGNCDQFWPFGEGHKNSGTCELLIEHPRRWPESHPLKPDCWTAIIPGRGTRG